MKILEKIKKTIFGIGILLMYLPNKIFAIEQAIQQIGPGSTYYGVPDFKRNTLTLPIKILTILKNIGLPIVLLVGLVIYLKKSKASKKKKIIATVCTILLGILLYFIITGVINRYLAEV